MRTDSLWKLLTIRRRTLTQNRGASCIRRRTQNETTICDRIILSDAHSAGDAAYKRAGHRKVQRGRRRWTRFVIGLVCREKLKLIGEGFDGDLALEINGVIVAEGPNDLARRAVVKLRASFLNIQTGPNRVRLRKAGLWSNIYIFYF